MPNTRRSMPKKQAVFANGASLPEAPRLCETDARKIFICVAEGKVGAFNIIKTTDKKLLLSPPPLEYKDGIYVLLSSTSKVHPNLEHLVISDVAIRSMTSCKWALSGPGNKTKIPGALQQRYSYPRGRPQYSNTKGGSMWTMIDSEGNDGLNVRVFHVYQSLKRHSSGSVTFSGSGSTEWGSLDSVKKLEVNAMTSRKHQQPLKKRIKMEEDNRVAKLKKSDSYEDYDTLMQDQQISSPDVSSFDLDTSLKISEDTIFAEDICNGYPFIPVPNAPSVMEPYPVPVSASSHYTAPQLPLPCSYDTSSQNNQRAGRPLGLLAFTNKLYQLQDCIFNDMASTDSCEEQAQKLAVLQHWAKATAQRPLQSCPRVSLSALAEEVVEEVVSASVNCSTSGKIIAL